MSNVSKVVASLPSKYREVVCSLKDSSYDETNDIYMVECSYEVLDYDKIAEMHRSESGYSHIMSSADAVYVTNDSVPYFIEFKNGSINRLNIQKKGIGSAMLAMDLGIVDSLKELQDKAVYILVYNEAVIEHQQSKSQKRMLNATRQRAGREVRRLIELDGVAWICHEAFSYTVTEFEENFINPIVVPEYQPAIL